MCCMRWRGVRYPSQFVLGSQLMATPEDVDYADIEKHEFAQYILREHGTYFPKWAPVDVESLRHSQSCRFEDMSGFVESAPNVKQRIDQLQTQHTAQLEKLYARQAAQYLEDALDRYAAQDDEAGSGYSDDINVRHSQYSTNFNRLMVFVSRSSMVDLDMGKQAWKTGLIARRRWCALRTWRPLLHCDISSQSNKGKKNRESGVTCTFLSPPSSSTPFRIRNYNIALRVS